MSTYDVRAGDCEQIEEIIFSSPGEEDVVATHLVRSHNLRTVRII